MVTAAVVLGLDEFRETLEELSEQTEAVSSQAVSAIEREFVGIDTMASNLSTNRAL
jgi:hypothetical protein